METPSRQDHSYVSSQTLVQFLGPSDVLKRSTFPCGGFLGGWYGHTVDGTNPAANGKYQGKNRVSNMSAGAGFFPSTALALYNRHLSRCMWWYIFNFRVLDLKTLKGTHLFREIITILKRNPLLTFTYPPVIHFVSSSGLHPLTTNNNIPLNRKKVVVSHISSFSPLLEEMIHFD